MRLLIENAKKFLKFLVFSNISITFALVVSA